MLDHYRETKVPVKAVIDFTDTKKYYNPEDWGEDVGYNKINVPG